MWRFLSRSYGETEGYSTGSLQEFKGNPLQALAREICQNSLDATDGSGKPVIVEFKNEFIRLSDFPGMDSMKQVINACDKFWKDKKDINTSNFLNYAKQNINKETCLNMLIGLSTNILTKRFGTFPIYHYSYNKIATR